MFGKKAIGPLVIILIGLALFIINLFEMQKDKSTIWGMVSNILLIVAMVLVMVKNTKKSKE
ncbi:hypothetical protein GO009_01150 [Muricauda sp. TY007]|uniref:hypothetical protein n=1 Tax=Allomuricauda sp. TY007 TaxID=2683200 RepID=UPI0013C1F74C|nr:hypothetical protein [Muricauda sp. TY007]NDV14618.1 hypothetical protein [Muricauda sp. TY007]